ncbi:MAG TPA: CoA transferase [Ottowia sp.]|uniref:CaiB/BaiF CoA transferase family protein n=1 Tax=Ottowia sp. TaxID=1898956 RepID=UPI002C8A9855|nr:CoA transferase [Ottowia sp.]HMN20944.1 CoA transferase [Ottowia sp.]
MEPIFAGLKVIDCGSFIASPVAATLLADYGADVIKIEPPGGDTSRILPSLPGMPKAGDHPYTWMLDNRGKRGLALDLRLPEAQAVLQRLAAQADIFITNYPLQARARLGLDHERLMARNDRLIYASFTGYGETGPEANKPGFDITAYWARSGLMAMVLPDAGSPPARALPGMGDHPSGVSLFAAIMVALYQRERTGRGTRVGSSLLANGMWANGTQIQAALCGGSFSKRPPREEYFNALSCHYRCRDRHWLILTTVNEERDWPRLAECLGLAELVQDARFGTRAARYDNRVALIAHFDAAFASRDRDDWCRILGEAGVVFERIAEMADMAGDEQSRIAGVLVPFADDPAALTLAGPFYVDGAGVSAPGKAPAIGEHTDAILRQAGYGAAEITALRQARAIA